MGDLHNIIPALIGSKALGIQLLWKKYFERTMAAVEISAGNSTLVDKFIIYFLYIISMHLQAKPYYIMKLGN
jgi:hypothetical protein